MISVDRPHRATTGTTTRVAGRPLRLAAVVAVGIMIVTGTVAADPLADAVGKLDPAIRTTRIPGHWEDGDKQGIYRVVVARPDAAKSGARLFIQWVVLRADGSQSLERSVEITEFGQLGVDIADFVAEPEGGGLTVFIDVANATGDAPASYELIIENDGTYRFDPSSN